MHLESHGLAANTINQQLAAVRRLAHEAADSGLLSPELAAGISRRASSSSVFVPATEEELCGFSEDKLKTIPFFRQILGTRRCLHSERYR
jgi:hypothetical protein